MIALTLYLLIGAGIGAALGHFGKCAPGGCPLTANWRRGALYGATLGLILHFASAKNDPAAMNESTPNVKRIEEARFESEVAQSALPVVVDFYATWCGPCKVLAPKMEEMAGQFANRIKFVKVNVDESAGLARQFQVEAFPTVLFFRGGKVVDRLVGLTDDSNLKTRLGSLARTTAAADPD